MSRSDRTPMPNRDDRRAPPTGSVSPYDALLLVSFGGPERPEDVLPFLRNVTAGRGVPPARLAEVAEHYYELGGRSPINDQARALQAAVRAELRGAGFDIPVYWGNRNWAPTLRDAVRAMAADGIARAACFVTSAYSSYSGCRQYREDLFAAAADVPRAPRLDRLRHYCNHPGFLEPFVDSTLSALSSLPVHARSQARLAFVTHSIPTAMNAGSGRGPGGEGGAYLRQHGGVADTVAAAVSKRTGQSYPYELVYCSRSGPPTVPWLEPDVNDHIRSIAGAGATGVVVVPIGFVSDHMEVRYDLDTEAAETAESLGLPFARAGTPGVDRRFVAMVRALLEERAAVERSGGAVTRARTGDVPATWDTCPAGCCPNLREPARPAIGGVDSPQDAAVP